MTRPVRLLGLCVLPRLDLLQPDPQPVHLLFNGPDPGQIVGKQRPLRLSGLLDLSGPEDLARLIPETFTALGNRSDQPSLEELADLCADSPAWNEGGGFYLTENSLCLIVSDGRYDYVLEAPLASLPLLTEL